MVTVAQLVRAPDCGSGGCGFNSHQSPCSGLSDPCSGPRRSVAQLVEHRSPKPAVGGSSPSGPVLLSTGQQVDSSRARSVHAAVSSRGLGRSPLKAQTRVRIPLPLLGSTRSAARSPAGVRPHRLSVRTSPFQGGETGSTPVGAIALATDRRRIADGSQTDRAQRADSRNTQARAARPGGAAARPMGL